MSNDGLGPQISNDNATSVEHLNNILIDLKSSDVHTCYTALVSLRVALEKGLEILYFWKVLNPIRS